jgi:hypothetical protein
MITESRDVANVVRVVECSSGELLAIARCTDGTYGILLSGRLIESLDWNSNRFHECLSLVEHLATIRGYQSHGDVQPSLLALAS